MHLIFINWQQLFYLGYSFLLIHFNKCQCIYLCGSTLYVFLLCKIYVVTCLTEYIYVYCHKIAKDILLSGLKI